MSDQDWGNDQEKSKGKKRGLPGWVWGCGIGCGVMLVVIAIAFWLGARVIKDMVDQDVVWANIGEVLPVEEIPEDYFALQVPFEIEGATMWVISHESGERSIVMFSAEAGSEASKMRDGLMDGSSEQSVGGPLGDFGRHGLEVGTITAQGRALECLRFSALPEEGGNALTGFANLDGSTMMVDLAPEDSGELLVMQFTNQGEDQAVPDKDVIEFLGHFRLSGEGASTSAAEQETDPTEEVEEIEAPVDPVPVGDDR